MGSPVTQPRLKLIVGLGNPGHTFHRTRHNVGFMLVESFAKQHDVEIAHRVLSQRDGRPAGVYGECREGAWTVRVLMPLTMMNESGDVLRGLEVPTEHLLLVCDDINLPLGTLRFRAEGGAGGHHGLESCLGVLGTEAVPRLRLGTGMTPMPRDLHEVVLSPFAKEELPVITDAVERAVGACDMWVKEGIDAAMNRYNTTKEP